MRPFQTTQQKPHHTVLLKNNTCQKTVCSLGLLIGMIFSDSDGQNKNHDTNYHQPNIIIINADDLGYGDLSCYGSTKTTTPHIDKLAKEGRKFTDAHSPSSVCSPSRYGLLTGQYPLRKNLWGPLPFHTELTIDTDSTTLASLLKKAGYSTACIGKWHLGFGQGKTDWNAKLAPGPLELGFDYYFGIPSVNSGPPFVYVENHHVVGYDPKDPFVLKKKSATKKIPEKSGYNAIGGAKNAHKLYVDELIGTTLKNKSVEWIKKQDKPFFLYLATTNIHHPFTPAKQFVGTSQCGLYGDFIHELDWIVGEILKSVEEKGQTNNTLVIFTSDNGGMLNVTGQKAWKAGHKLNGNLLGFKFGAWEGGHRIPLIIKWPGKVPKSTSSNHLISQIDFLATLAALQGIQLDPAQNPDSINQLPELLGQTNKPLRHELVIHCNSPKHLAIRTSKWLYIPTQNEGGFDGTRWGSHLLGGAAALKYTGQTNSDIRDGKIVTSAPPAQLYDLQNDPYQKVNVFKDHPDVVSKLRQREQHYRKLRGKGKPIGWISKQ